MPASFVTLFCLLASLAVGASGCRPPAKGHIGASYAVGPKGEIAYTTGSSPSNRLMLKTGDQVRELAKGGYFEGVTFSPDGKHLVYSAGPNHDTRLSLRHLDLASGKSVTLPEAVDQNQLSPEFSPDGKWIAYRAAKQPQLGSMKTGSWKRFEIWITDLKGNRKQLTTDKFQKVSGPKWSPDGWKIVFSLFDSLHLPALRVIDSSNGAKIRGMELLANENHPFYLRDEIALVTDRNHPLSYVIATLKVNDELKPLNLEPGYYMLPSMGRDGKLYALEDFSKNLKFRLIEIDPESGKKTVALDESYFDDIKSK